MAARTFIYIKYAYKTFMDALKNHHSSYISNDIHLINLMQEDYNKSIIICILMLKIVCSTVLNVSSIHTKDRKK